MRLRNDVVLQVALLMLGFGVLIGILFPFFSDFILALPKAKVYTTLLLGNFFGNTK